MPPARQVYLDHSASTPVDDRVIDAMLPYFGEIYGNSSSAHGAGMAAERAIEAARETIAGILNCQPSEIVFTSCGSESDNLALRGVAWHQRGQGKSPRLITTPIEHSAVTNTVRQLHELMGFDAFTVPVDPQGFVEESAFAEACAGGGIASVVYASNEVGTIQDLPRLSAITRENGALLHTDAVQAGGQLSLDVDELGVDLLSLSAHKFYGPKGVGLLYVRDGVDLAAAQTGGSHENNRRAGSHNTALIVGMAKALELAYADCDERTRHYQRLRDLLIDGVLNRVPGAELSGHPTRRLPSHASFILHGIDANALLMHLDMRGVAASSGSACKVGDPEPSEILLGLGYSPEAARSGLRLSVGMSTSEDDVIYALDAIEAAALNMLRLRREFA